MITPPSQYTPDTMPATIPVFPLGEVLLLPRTDLPLNIFEPRYLAMIDDAMRGHRLIGIIQPKTGKLLAEIAKIGSKCPAPPLQPIGCAGRITSYHETGDGRLLISLTGVARFLIVEELLVETPYRQCRISCANFKNDFTSGFGEENVDRTHLIEVLKEYLDINGIDADWESIAKSSNEELVNSLSMISPYGPKEKQAMLEAATLEQRNQLLIALTERSLAQSDPEAPDTTLQ